VNLRDWVRGVYEERGEVTAALLVDDARPEDHPYHHRFEWDDTVAGEAYRRVQAADIIRSLNVTYGKDSRGRDKHVREYLSFDDGTGRAYRPTAEVVHDDVGYQVLLRMAKREAHTFQTKYSHLKEYGEIVRGMEAAS
jgi:hypothetical protein